MWDNRSRRSDKPREQGDDGDTVLFISDLGRGVFDEAPIRLKGCWAPEKKQLGHAEAAKFLNLVMSEVEDRARAHRIRWPFLVVTEPNTSPEPAERQSFVRFIGTVYAMDTHECINDEVIAFLAQHPEWSRGTGGTDEAVR